MRGYIEDRMKSISEEAFSNPLVVKYYKNRSLHTMILTDESMYRSKLEFMRYVESNLRIKEKRTSQDREAAELLYAFRLNRVIGVCVTTKAINRVYKEPVYIRGEYGVEVP